MSKAKPGNEKQNYIDASEVPKLDMTSLEQLKSLFISDCTSLEFDDNLKVYSLSGNEIGDFSVRAKQVLYKNQDCFQITAKSIGLIDDVLCGTEVTSYVNQFFETLDQEHHEFIKYEKHPLDRRTFITKEDNDEYSINQITTNSLNTKNVNVRIVAALMQGFVSEGANLLLQRMMIQKNILEKLTLFTFDSNVHPCLVSYKPLDKRNMKIKDDLYDIIGLERTIESTSELPTTWQIYFTMDGHMVNRVQIGSPAVMKATEPPKQIELDEYLPKPVIEKKELNWENDIQLYSQYMDRKDELTNEYNQYLHDHSDLKNLLADFMQSVLTHKPQNILTFSAQFFAPYSSKTTNDNLFPSTIIPRNIPRH